MHSFVLQGLNEFSTPPEVTNTKQSSAWDPKKKNLQLKNMTLTVHEDSSVNYRYQLRNFNSSSRGPTASNRFIDSTTKCTQLKKT
jgi:hypothetical protein